MENSREFSLTASDQHLLRGCGVDIDDLLATPVETSMETGSELEAEYHFDTWATLQTGSAALQWRNEAIASRFIIGLLTVLLVLSLARP